MKNKTIKTALASRHARSLLQSVFSIFFLAATTQAQVTNKALGLNGSNSYANLGTISPAGNFSSGFTIEAWVKWNAFNSWSRIVELGNGPGSNNILLCNESTTMKLRAEVYNNGTTQGLSTPASLTVGRWYHVAVTQTSTGLTTLYVNGVSAASTTLQKPLNVSRSQCYIGRSSWASDGYLYGSVDEVRIWNVARTATEIRQNMLKPVAANAAGLVSYYACNESSGTLLANAASNGGALNGNFLNGSRIASPVHATPNALNLDGADDVVSIGAPLAANSSYTKEAWVYVTKSPLQPQNIISSQGSPLWIDGSLKAGNNGSSFQVSDNISFPTNTWVHVAVTYDAASRIMNLYRNGVVVSSATVIQAYQGQNNFIGAWHDGVANTAFLGGKIDEVRIWNVARTAPEIAANMSKEVDAAAEPNLVTRFSFNQGTADGDNTGMVTLACQKSMLNATLMNMTLSGTTSNYVQQKADLFALPVRLQAFTAQKRGTNALLQWSTAAEQNAARFVVEHSTNGQQWKPIDEVAAAGNSNTTLHYSYVHTTPAKGLNHYRLVLVDNDGKKGFSHVSVLTFDESSKVFTVQNNTVSNGLLQVHVHTRTTLSLFTQDGKIIWNKELPTGMQTIPLGGLAKGLHYLSGSGVTERIMLQ